MSTELDAADVADDLPPKNRPWLTVVLGLFIFVAYLLSQSIVVGVFLAVELSQDPDLDVEAWVERAQHNGTIVALCALAGAVVSVPLVLFAARLASRGMAQEHLGLRMPSGGSLVRWLLALAAFIATIDGINWLLGRAIVPAFMRESYLTAEPVVLLWLALLIAAPLTEELLFRGLLFGGLARSALGPLGAAVLTTLVWSALHMQYDLIDIGSIFLGGLLLAAARYATESVVLCIILHSVMNLVATVETVIALRMN